MRPAYVLGVLLLVHILNFVDRNILAIVAGDIKAEMDLSDTELGILLGPAFATFFSLAGIPIARLADMTSRRNVIAVGLVLWSAMTAASGLALNFWHIALARFGVSRGRGVLHAGLALDPVADLRSAAPRHRARDLWDRHLLRHDVRLRGRRLGARQLRLAHRVLRRRRARRTARCSCSSSR